MWLQETRWHTQIAFTPEIKCHCLENQVETGLSLLTTGNSLFGFSKDAAWEEHEEDRTHDGHSPNVNSITCFILT